MQNVSWKKTDDVYYLASPTEELVKLQLRNDKTIFWLNDEVYEIKRKGFWNQRYTIINKGKEVASLSHDFWGSKGKILFYDGITYTSRYLYKDVLTLYFSDNGAEIVKYHVGMNNNKQEAVFTPGIALVDAERLLILATLGMVMFLNIFNEFKEGDDGFLLLATASS